MNRASRWAGRVFCTSASRVQAMTSRLFKLAERRCSSALAKLRCNGETRSSLTATVLAAAAMSQTALALADQPVVRHPLEERRQANPRLGLIQSQDR